MEFFHETLPNGLQLIAETNPRAHSAAIGFFVRCGARDESAELSGVSHFLEHMAFKGDDRYTADDVNRIFDEIGANYNASTSEEATIYYAAILPEYLEQTVDLLTTLLRPSLRDDDFETEKQVILEEIGMYDDMPAFVAHDHVMQAHFGEHALGQRVLGTTDSVSALTSTQMRDYHSERYGAGNITVVAAGKLDFAELLSMIKDRCGTWTPGASARDVREARPAGARQAVLRPNALQEHVAALSSAPPADSPLRYAAEIVSLVVGDDSGSRLYWELVDPGLVESAELGFYDYEGSGVWMTYFCCPPVQTPDILSRIAAIYAEVNRDGITADELRRAQNKAASRIVLQAERPMGRLSSLGGNWLYRGRYETVQDELAAIEGVTLEGVRELLAGYPLGETTTVGVGPLAELVGLG